MNITFVENIYGDIQTYMTATSNYLLVNKAPFWTSSVERTSQTTLICAWPLDNILTHHRQTIAVLAIDKHRTGWLAWLLRPIDWPIDWPSHWLIDWFIDWLIDCPLRRPPTDRPAGNRPNDGQIDCHHCGCHWLIDWLPNWLADCPLQKSLTDCPVQRIDRELPAYRQPHTHYCQVISKVLFSSNHPHIHAICT